MHIKDCQIELEANVSEVAADNYFGQNVREGGLWPEGKIYYRIEDVCHDNLLNQTLQEALKEWNEEIKSCINFKNSELRRVADTMTTFSNGDKAAIRILYGKKGIHHGEWHKCISEKLCYYKCKEMLSGVRCGYWGSEGHWSCCMKEKFKSQCFNESYKNNIF